MAIGLLVYMVGEDDPYIVKGAFKVGYVKERIRRGEWVWVPSKDGCGDDKINGRLVTKVARVDL